jgi:hypothetical protein
MLGVLEDDKEFLTEFYKKVATRSGISVQMFPTSETFIEHLTEDIHIAIIDHFLDPLSRANSITGLDVMEKILEINPFAYIIVVSAQPSMEIAIKYINGTPKTKWKGCWKYIDKRGRTDDDVQTEALIYVDFAITQIQEEIAFFSPIQIMLSETEKKLDTQTHGNDAADTNG